ncbi:MAG TPA: DNA polymerase III subunit alpha, partial [Deinococcales bacterium]|nr:DNA polymerase III subunit alpha [Deinococcales bacterium]
DIDFSDARRGEVIDYVRQKYGEDRVVHIATFGTMASKAAIRDAARVLDVPYGDADRASKLIPVTMGRSHSIEDSLSGVPEFRELYEAGGRNYIDIARNLEGLTRHASVHAAGIVIGRDPIDDLAPIFRGSDEQAIVQYDMTAIEDLGFIKMDFLGLRTLSFIEAAVRIIRETHGVELEPDNFPIDDEKTFDLFCRGDAKGVFQFESAGMVDLLRRVGPRRLEDLIALNALYRPGPMDNIPTYARRFSGQEEVSYDDFPVLGEKLEPLLRETYGIPVYQEQVMQIVQAVADYSLGEADIMRRAMGKKSAEVMREERVRFLERTDGLGIPHDEADRLFTLLERFADYGFNKSHSAAYVILAYQTAYLKAHYPVAFAAALLTIERADSDKVAEYVGDARSMNVDVLPPDINESRADFTPVGDVVRFGLYGIRNVGENIIDAIVRAREKEGPFRDLFDFAKRVAGLNRRTLEYLVKAGAFDGLGDRSTLLANVETALRWGQDQQAQAKGGQLGLFGELEITPPEVEAEEPLSQLELLAMEKDALGLYISDHPMNSYPGLAEAASSTISGAERWFRRQDPKDLYRGRARIALSGLLQRVSKRLTRRGTMMASFELADDTGSREIVAFSRAYEAMADTLINELPVVLVAEASLDDGEFRLIAERLYPWTEKESLPRVALFEVADGGFDRERLTDLRSLVDDYSGLLPVRFVLQDGEDVVTWAADGVRVDEQRLAELEHECPWLKTRVTLDREQLLRERDRGANPFVPAAAPAHASVDTPF